MSDLTDHYRDDAMLSEIDALTAERDELKREAALQRVSDFGQIQALTEERDALRERVRELTTQAMFNASTIERLSALVCDMSRELANARAADIHSCHDGCTRAGCVNGRLRAQVAALEVEVRKISGGAGVYMGLLVDCTAVLRTIDPDDSDEAEKLRDLLDAIDRALEPSRHKGPLL